MSQKQSVNFSIEELIAITVSDTGVSEEVLEQFAVFTYTTGIKHGKKLVNNLIIYDLYVKWSQLNVNDGHIIDLRKFNELFSHFFPKRKNSTNNLCYKISPKLKTGKLDLSKKHLAECRTKYGRKKSKTKVEEITN